MGRILAVDDDQATLQIIAETIESLGLSGHLCSDGIHALDALQCNDDFDVMVTDVSMPVMDGRQLIEMLQRDPALPSIPVIIMSGVVSIKEISDLMKKGAARFIAKPFGTDDLKEAITSCLEMKLGAER